MNYFFYISLFIFWNLFWSFASVLIYRLHSQESGILNWRSHCNNCNHTLWFFDLIPIFSWLFNKAKCKYCKSKISSIYPILELSTWLLFVLIWYFLIDFNFIINWNYNEIIKLFFWLSIWFITILYTFYDILFMEIHDWIILSWIVLIILAIIFQSFRLINILPEFDIINSYNDLNILYSLILLIISISWLYIIMLWELNDIIDTLILIFIISLICTFKIYFSNNTSDYLAINSLIWALIIFIFFYIQYIIWVILHQIEKRNKKKKDYRFQDWIIWWGDLRIAIMVWLLLWMILTWPWLMMTYIVWTIISILFIIIQKLKNKQINTQVPFWPFLALWFFITIFYYKEFYSLVTIYFL